jgi:hypothetical protein
VASHGLSRSLQKPKTKSRGKLVKHLTKAIGIRQKNVGRALLEPAPTNRGKAIARAAGAIRGAEAADVFDARP